MQNELVLPILCASRKWPNRNMFPVLIYMMNNQLKYLLSIYFAQKLHNPDSLYATMIALDSIHSLL